MSMELKLENIRIATDGRAYATGYYGGTVYVKQIDIYRV